MNRREFVRNAGAAGVGAAATRRGAAGTGAGGGKRQVVVICGESVRYDMLNCHRQTGLKTPNLDRLAAGGTRFDRAYNCQPVCSPARSALWTGLYPHSNGVWGNSMALGDTTHTIGQRLTDKGVHCGFIGKWHLSGTDYFDTGRVPAGWDARYWYDMRSYLQELSPRDRLRSRAPETADDPTWTAEMCYAQRCTDRAVNFLEERSAQDFLLVVAHDEPHGPSLCPMEYTRMYEGFEFPQGANVGDTLANKPEHERVWAGPLPEHARRPQRRAQFFGSHTFVDHQIGRILDQVEKTAPGALVIYTADHGVFLEAHRLTDKGPAMYEEITHIPFIVRWPGHTPAGARSTSLVSQVDLAATLMEFFGQEVPKTLEGVSLLPMLRDPSAKVRDAVFVEWGRYEVDHDGFGGYQPIRCVCDGRYKLSVNLMATDELYDLETDPGEMRNLIDSSEHAAIRNALHDRLLAQMDVSRDPFRGYYWGRRAWRPEYPVRWANDGMTRQREDDGYLPRELDYDTGLPMDRATRPKADDTAARTAVAHRLGIR